MYYLFCIELNRTENEFENSTLAKVAKLIDLHSKIKYPADDNATQATNMPIVKSLKDIPGFI